LLLATERRGHRHIAAASVSDAFALIATLAVVACAQAAETFF
jgi:hypothetical protein